MAALELYRRDVADPSRSFEKRTDKAQRTALYKAIVQVIQRAIGLKGRTDEHDLFDETGRYARLLSAAAAGQPCPACGKAAILKESFLGGAVYTCPECQPAPPKQDRRTQKKTS
jgi:formamidopyrimidine-DNA glycosylase